MSSFHVLVNWFIIIYKKCFALHENNLSAFKNVPQNVKQRINTEHIYINDFVMSCQ